MAGITVACSHCGAQLKLKDDSKVGRKAPCPKCKQLFVITPIDDGAGPDFDLDDDFDEPVAAAAPRASKKKGSDGSGKSSKKGKKGQSSGGGLPVPALIGGGVLVLLLGVVGLLWGLGVFGGGDENAAPPVVAENAPAESTDPAMMAENGGEAGNPEMPMTAEAAPSGESPTGASTPSNPESATPDPASVTGAGTATPASGTSGPPATNIAPPLDLLHPRSEMVIHLNVARMLATPLMKQWRSFATAQSGGDPLDAIQAETGFDLTKVQTVTFGLADIAQPQQAAMMTPESAAAATGVDENGDAVSSPAMSAPPGGFGGSMAPPGVPKRVPPFVCIVRFGDGVDVATLRPLTEGEAVTEGNATYHRAPPVPGQPPMIASKVDNQLLAIGTEEALLPLLRQSRPWSPEVAQRFAMTDFDHHLSVVIDAAIIPPAEASPVPTPPEFQQLDQLVRQQTTGFMVALDLSASLDLRLGAQANDAQGAAGYNSELTRLWAMVPPQMDNLPPLLPEGLKTLLSEIVNSASVESKDASTYLHLTATGDQLQSLATEAQGAAGMLMMMAMANGGGAGMNPFGGLPDAISEPVSLPLGERVLIEGMEPTSVSGLPEGMVAAGLVDWEIVTDPQGVESIEPVVLVAIDAGADQTIAAYRATEKIPDRRRSAGQILETTRDEIVADDPMTGVLVRFHPTLPSSLQETLPNFESQLLLRVCAAPHEIKVPNVLKLNGPIDDDVVRPLAMRVSNEEGVLKLMYRANTRVVVGVSKLESVAELSGAAALPGTAAPGTAFGDGTASTEGAFIGGGAVAGTGVTRTKTETNGNVTISFEGALPSDAALTVVVYPDLSVSNTKFQFQGLPVPPKPESVEALRAEQNGGAAGANGAMPSDGPFNN